MTTPTLSDKLGDFFAVQLSPKLPVPVINGIPGATVTLANQDLTQNVTISRNNSVSGGATIPPLGSVTVDMSKTIWGTAPAGTLPLLVFPGGGSWAPSPAQVAASINALGLMKDTTGQTINTTAGGTTTAVGGTTAAVAAQTSGGATIASNISTTGVPLLTKSSALYDSTPTAVLTTATLSSGTLTVSQIGYEVLVTMVEAAGGGTPLNMMDLTFTWSDSTSGQVITNETWKIAPGALANTHQLRGTGPTKGDRLVITVKNNDTVTVNVRIIIVQNSRVYVKDDLRTWAMPAINGQNLPSFDVTNNVIGFRFIAALGAATSDAVICPLVAGRAKIHWDSGSAAADCEITFRIMNPFLNVAGNIPFSYDAITSGNGNANDYVTLPRSQLRVDIRNGNAAAKQVRWVMTLEEY
jgi:hypothetical protein